MNNLAESEITSPRYTLVYKYIPISITENQVWKEALNYFSPIALLLLRYIQHK